MATKPNLLFIFTDEQRFDTMACYGNTELTTIVRFIISNFRDGPAIRSG